MKYGGSEDLQAKAARNVIDQSWFLMMYSYSRRFCLGFTQCGPLFSLCITDRGGNSIITSVDVEQQQYVHAFLQVIAHLTLAPDQEVGDEHHFPTFAGKYVMSFPQHPFVSHSPPRQPKLPPPYLMQLEIQSRLFHNFSFTGKGTQILLARPKTSASPSDPKYVVVKDSWPTPSETDEAYLINHIRSCLKTHLEGLERSGLNTDLTLQNFPEVLHEYLCETPHPNVDTWVHDGTNVRRGHAVADMMHEGVMILDGTFERRSHYRVVFKDIVVDSTWFASRREFFQCLLTTLKGKVLRIFIVGVAAYFSVQRTNLLLRHARFSIRTSLL